MLNVAKDFTKPLNHQISCRSRGGVKSLLEKNIHTFPAAASKLDWAYITMYTGPSLVSCIVFLLGTTSCFGRYYQ